MQIAGEITALDFTLRRISSIEQSFNRIFELPIEAQSAPAQNFQEIMNQTSNDMEKTSATNTTSTKAPLPTALNQSSVATSNDKPTEPKEIEGLIDKYSKANNLDPNLVKALILQESGLNPNATSKCGAMGLMQLMPSTARGLGVNNAYDPEENIMGGTKYLKSLLNRFNQDTELALAAYNAGPGAVNKYGGIPPYKETQNYVKNIMANWENLKG